MIGIVGGGIAGLAAAYRLQRLGHTVTVYEANDTVGGLAATYETEGDPIEQFYHHLSASEQTIVDLATALELPGSEAGDDPVEWRVGKNAYYVDGSIYPLDTPAEILSYPYLSVYDKFRLGMLTMGIDVRKGIPSFDTYDDVKQFEDVPIREFLLDHTTANVYEHFFEPLLSAKFGSRKDDVSAAWLLGRIRFRGERDPLRGEILGYLEGGFAELIDALIDAIGREHIVTGTRVTAIEREDGHVSALTTESETGRRTHPVDAVVVAAMPTVLESLTGYECKIDFQGSVCAVLSMAESVLDTYWLNIANEAPFGVLIEHTNFVPPDRYGDNHLLYAASYVQDPTEQLWQMTDDEVQAHWVAGIETLFESFDRSAINWMRVSRNPRTAPIYERGYLDMVVPYDLAEDVASGVYYAGMASRAQYPERSLNGGIVAGYECADRIADSIDQPPSSTAEPVP